MALWTPDEFTDAVASKLPWILVLFHMPWAPPSIEVRHTWAIAATTLRKIKGLHFASVDAVEQVGSTG